MGDRRVLVCMLFLLDGIVIIMTLPKIVLKVEIGDLGIDFKIPIPT